MFSMIQYTYGTIVSCIDNLTGQPHAGWRSEYEGKPMMFILYESDVTEKCFFCGYIADPTAPTYPYLRSVLEDLTTSEDGIFQFKTTNSTYIFRLGIAGIPTQERDRIYIIDRIVRDAVEALCLDTGRGYDDLIKSSRTCRSIVNAVNPILSMLVKYLLSPEMVICSTLENVPINSIMFQKC